MTSQQCLQEASQVFTFEKCGKTIPLKAKLRLHVAHKHTSPINRLQVGAADVSKLSGRLVNNVVRHMAGVPDHHVVVIDRFAVNEAVEVCLGDAAESAGAVDSVVKL